MLTLRGIAVAALAVFLIGAAPQRQVATATFAGGCFWCMQPPFEKLGGVVSVKAGYTGGSTKNPTYEEVSAGGTGHRESVEIVYDPSKISYAQLLDVFWHNIDPVDNSGQFCDHGPQYRSAIFYHGAEQKTLAEQSKAAVSGQLRKPIATDILPASQFYPAERYHQDYYRKNPVRYNFYRFNCGRDQRLTEVWGKAPAH
jgi:peptide-methionine (S)-S-oxide reductase